MKQDSIIRTIYLYIFALLGLVLLIIGGVRFIDMGLKAFIFTKADEEQRINYYSPVYSPISLERVEKIESDESFTDEEKTAFRQWLKDYEEQKEKMENFDYLVSRRQRDASINLAMIIVGLPLYLYHWSIIRKETKRE